MSRHSVKAKELFDKGYNCSQAVFAAFCDETGLDFETALKLSSSFGGGMGRLREVCGAVSGIFMVIGLKYGYTDPSDKALKSDHYKLIRSLADQFKEKNNSIICRELTGFNTVHDSPASEGKTETNKHSCSDLVEQAAIILDEYIQSKEAKHNID